MTQMSALVTEVFSIFIHIVHRVFFLQLFQYLYLLSEVCFTLQKSSLLYAF